MNFWRGKNIQKWRLAGRWLGGGLRQVVMVKMDPPIKNFPVLGRSGDVAHFFSTLIWTNETGAMVKSDAGLAIESMVKPLIIDKK